MKKNVPETFIIIDTTFFPYLFFRPRFYIHLDTT